MPFRVQSFLCAALLGSLACGDAGGEGELSVTLYGEDFVELGIPADAMADDWSVAFDRFEVTVDEVVVGGMPLGTELTLDLAASSEGAGHPVASATVPAGAYGDASFAILRLEVDGSATRGAETKRFAWVFDGTTRYEACETTTEVRPDGAATFEITVHADHLFFDSLVAEEPAVVFQALADADADGDGIIARAELERADIGAYDPGSEGGIDDLWAWLVAQSQRVGHVDGEGHCDTRVPLP